MTDSIIHINFKRVVMPVVACFLLLPSCLRDEALGYKEPASIPDIPIFPERMEKVFPSLNLHIQTADTMLHVTHIRGENVHGVVDWGDGSSDTVRAELAHHYADTFPHTMKARLHGTESFTIPSLEGITAISFIRDE